MTNATQTYAHISSIAFISISFNYIAIPEMSASRTTVVSARPSTASSSMHNRRLQLRTERWRTAMTLLKSLREAVYCNVTTLRLVQCRNPLSTSEDFSMVFVTVWREMQSSSELVQRSKLVLKTLIWNQFKSVEKNTS